MRSIDNALTSVSPARSPSAAPATRLMPDDSPSTSRNVDPPCHQSPPRPRRHTIAEVVASRRARATRRYAVGIRLERESRVRPGPSHCRTASCTRRRWRRPRATVSPGPTTPRGTRVYSSGFQVMCREPGATNTTSPPGNTDRKPLRPAASHGRTAASAADAPAATRRRTAATLGNRSDSVFGPETVAARALIAAPSRRSIASTRHASRGRRAPRHRPSGRAVSPSLAHRVPCVLGLSDAERRPALRMHFDHDRQPRRGADRLAARRAARESPHPARPSESPTARRSSSRHTSSIVTTATSLLHGFGVGVDGRDEAVHVRHRAARRTDAESRVPARSETAASISDTRLRPSPLNSICRRAIATLDGVGSNATTRPDGPLQRASSTA